MSMMHGVNCGISRDGLREFGVLLPAGMVSLSKLCGCVRGPFSQRAA